VTSSARGRCSANVPARAGNRCAAAPFASKIEGGADWLYTDEALHRRRRPPSRDIAHIDCGGVHDVTCSIGAELAALTGCRNGSSPAATRRIRLRMADTRPRRGGFRADALRPSPVTQSSSPTPRAAPMADGFTIRRDCSRRCRPALHTEPRTSR